MFGITFPPGADTVRIFALSGRQGKPPCLWEGPPHLDQASVEAQIASDNRLVRWLRRNNCIKDGVATLSLQFDLYSQGKKVDTMQAQEVTILLDKPRRKRGAADEVALRAFDMAESMVETCKELLEERETIIGRLIERGLKYNDKPLMVEPPKQDLVGEVLEKGTQFISLAKVFRELKDSN